LRRTSEDVDRKNRSSEVGAATGEGTGERPLRVAASRAIKFVVNAVNSQQLERNMIESAAVKDQIREYVVEEFAKTKGINQVSDQEVLTKNGIIDSMGIFRLVAFLEETFNVRIGDEEITHDNLESIDAIERLVLSKAKK
jgi:acyl carrier protein